MSYASERQKLREQRRLKTENNSAGGDMPPAVQTSAAVIEGADAFAAQRQQLRKKRQQTNSAASKPVSAVKSELPGVPSALQQFVQQQTERDLQYLEQQKKADEDNGRTWFQKGSDNAGKTIVGSGADVIESLLTGLTGIGEKVIDAGAALAPYLAYGAAQSMGGSTPVNMNLQQAENQMLQSNKDLASDFVAKDLYDEKQLAQKVVSDPLKKLTGIDTKKDSVFGEKTDALVQSGGQLLGTAALGAVGVPWWMTTGASALGSEAETALNSGATLDEAALSGAISAGAEILTEKISGGIKFGGKTLDDAITKKLANSISNKAVRALAKLGIDMAGEGGEEVLSGTVSKFGQWLTYQDDQTLNQMLFSEAALDEALESFIGGAAMGGFGSVAQGVRSEVARKDYVTGESKAQGVTKSQQEAQQGGQMGQADMDALIDETVAQLSGAPADPVNAAVESFESTGAVSNKQATDILNSVKAVQQLVEQTGVKLDGLTMAQRRNAVKTAVEQIAQQNAVATKEPDSTSAADEKSTTDWILDAVYGRSKQNETAEKANVPNAYEEYILHNEDGTPFEAVGAASLNNTGRANYQNLLTDENTQRDRLGDVRPVEVPKTDAEGRNVSNFVGNAYGSYLTTDSFTSTIEKLISQGDLSHDPLTNEKALEGAAQEISLDGIEKTLSNIRSDAESGIARPESVAKGTLLYRYLLESMDAQDDPAARAQIDNMAADLFVSMKHLSTAAGRSTQLFSMFRQLSPDGQTRAIAEEINRYVSRMKYLNKLPQEYVVPSLSSENPLFREFADASNAERNAATDTERKEARHRMAEAEDDIYASIASQIPATPADKWDAWRHLSMLGNARTQARNFISTAIFMPYRAVKQAVGSIIEMAIPQDQRTKAIVGFSKADRALLAWAKNDRYEPDVDRALRYTARLGESPAGAIIEDHRQIYTQKQLEQVRKFVRKIPARADLVFKRAEYASALAGFLKARGYTVEDILSAKVSDAVLNEGRQYAVDEAMKATFNDANAVSDAAAKMQFSGNGTLSKVGNILLQGAAPYRRTTANLAVRGLEYNPVGLFSGLWDSATKIKKGEITAAQAIDKVSAGLTGSSALLLGVALAGGMLGLRIRGSEVSDEEKETGAQEYSLEFSIDGKTYSYKIDWIGPTAIPLFIGANIRDYLRTAGEDLDASLLAKAIEFGWSTVEPIIDISVFSAIGDTLLDAKYAPDGMEFPYVMANLATSYFTQGIPQLVRQLVQAIPANEQETNVTASDPITRAAQRMAGNLPVVGQLFKKDKLDEDGNPVAREALPLRLIDSFFNPGKVSEVDTSEETKNEIQTKKTLAGFSRAFDSLAESFRGGTVDQKAVSNLDTVYRNYQKLSNELQGMIREEAGGRIGYYLTAKESGIDTGTFVSLYKDFYDIDQKEIKTKEKASQWAYILEEAEENGAITENQKNTLKEKMLFWQTIPAKTQKFDAMTESGISAKSAQYIEHLLADILPPRGKDDVQFWQQAEAISGANISNADKVSALKAYGSDAQDENLDLMLKTGFTTDDYVQALLAYTQEKEKGGKGTKARTIERLRREFKLSEEIAEAIYDIYG